jgi:YidC/Oxa1 family membrane protein insertase
MMMMLPVLFTFLFSSFPAGLVLYWTVNNSLSILQQWYITRKYGGAPSKGNNNKTSPKNLVTSK